MKKIIVLAMVYMAFVGISYGNIYVAWGSPGPFMWSSDASPLLRPIGSGNSTLAQLLWSPDNMADDANFGTQDYLSPTGNDVLLATHTITEGAYALSEYAWFDAPIFNDGGTNPLGGYIYARIFQSSTVNVDDWYYVGGLVLAENRNPVAPPGGTPDTAQQYNLSRDDNYNEIDGQFGRQVVPEPASISLLVLGAAVLGLRRRRR